MSYIKKKRKALTPNKKGYKKVSQDKTSEGWLPPVKSTPLIVSEERSFRHKVRVKEELRRPHVFQFKITRDDGVVIDPNLIYSISLWQTNIDNSSKRDFIGWAFGYPEDDPDEEKYWTYEDADEKGINGTWFYRKEEGSYGEIKFNYDTRTQIWTVPFFNRKFPKVRRHKIFWARFSVKDSVVAIYSPPAERIMPPEYKYKTAEFFQEEDKILPRFYTVRVPYYKAEFTEIRVPPIESSTFCITHKSRCNASTYGAKILKVASSIPYTVHYTAGGSQIAAYRGRWNVVCGHLTRSECYEYALENAWLLHIWEDGEWTTTIPIEEQLVFTCSNGVVSNNVKVNPIDSEELITPIPYTVDTQEHIISVQATGEDFVLLTPCTDGIQTFNVPFKIMKLQFSVWGYKVT